jgi:hypothetical protein
MALIAIVAAITAVIVGFVIDFLLTEGQGMDPLKPEGALKPDGALGVEA